jgi:hypothetical protein
MKKIKTFEDACEALNLNPAALPDVSMLPEENQKSVIALYKLSIIIKALNEGWYPDWKNTSKPKWYPYFEANASGFGFSLTYYGRWTTAAAADCGSRLCLKSDELAEYAGTEFIELYNDLLK